MWIWSHEGAFQEKCNWIMGFERRAFEPLYWSINTKLPPPASIPYFFTNLLGGYFYYISICTPKWCQDTVIKEQTVLSGPTRKQRSTLHPRVHQYQQDDSKFIHKLLCLRFSRYLCFQIKFNYRAFEFQI